MEDSVEYRQALEKKKALVKYGEIALRPSGHPDYDVFDYAINEVVGMIRYGEMLRERMKELFPDPDSFVRLATKGMFQEMQLFGENVGADLIALRKELIERGINLGKPEVR